MERSEFEATPAAVRQYQLSTLLVLTGFSAAAFAVARYFDFRGFAREYLREFHESPGYATVNLAVFGLLIWGTTRFFRRQIVEADLAWPTNGAYMGTICGGAVYGMILCELYACNMYPVYFVLAVLLCGGIGAGWAALAGLVPRAFVEPFEEQLELPRRCAVAGALVGAASGYFACGIVLLASPQDFIMVGLSPALVGAVFGARGAFLQAATHGRRLRFARERLERAMYPADSSDGEGANTCL